MNSEVLVKLPHCVAETVENAELVARWNHVDVTNLLRFNGVTISLRYNP